MPDADIGAAGSVWVGLETTYGTALNPASASGINVPILSETLAYTEPDRYYSEQIRQQAIHSDAKQSYYHVEGDIVMEVDARYMPYFLYASRHTVTKTGAGPYTYSAVPSARGTAYPGGAARGLTIAIKRDAVVFVYSGCVVTQWAHTIETGVLRVTMSILGLAEADGTMAVESWAAPVLFGADAHAISVDASGLTPAFATPDATFNGYTFTINHNGEPQNRLTRDRSASYVKFGITEVSFDTELDFVSKTEYTAFKALTFKAYRFESIVPGGVAGTWGTATSGYRITTYRGGYGTYEVGLSGMGDLVMARVTGRPIGITGGSGYNIECISPTSIT